MIQMSLSMLVIRPDAIQTPKSSAVIPMKIGPTYTRSDLVDVSETAQDAGIPYKMAVTGELYDRLQRCHPGDPYENEVVLWDVLWLGEFEHTLNMFVPAFTFTTTIPSTKGENESIRLHYVAGDPVVIEIAH